MLADLASLFIPAYLQKLRPIPRIIVHITPEVIQGKPSIATLQTTMRTSAGPTPIHGICNETGFYGISLDIPSRG